MIGHGCLYIANNQQNACHCSFKGCGSSEIFNVSDDGKGNSVLTGEGGKAAKFTCAEYEVF